MNPFSRVHRRAAAAAIACAAILTPAAALAAPGRPAAPAVAAPKCPTSSLRVWLGIPGDSAAGQTAYELELSNISHTTCTLFGYPGVSAVGLGGVQLGSPAVRDTADPTHLVTLGPGTTAHVFLRIVDVAFFPPASCEPTSAIGLKVFPPNDSVAAVVPFGFRACKKAGDKFLFVRTTVAHTGIPGYST